MECDYCGQNAIWRHKAALGSPIYTCELCQTKPDRTLYDRQKIGDLVNY